MQCRKPQETSVAERLRSLTLPYLIPPPYSTLVLVDNPMQHRWIARQAYGEDRLVVTSKHLGPDTPEYARMLAIVTYLHKAWKSRNIYPEHQTCDYLPAGFNGFLELATPTELPPSIRNYLDCRAVRLIQTFTADRILQHTIDVSRRWGTVPVEEWDPGFHGSQLTMYTEDVTVRSRRYHNCRRVAVILMSYKLKELLPVRDLRLLLGTMVWETSTHWKWVDMNEDSVLKQTKIE